MKDAQGGLHPTTQEPLINLEFNKEGTKIFADVTKRLTEEYRHGDPRRSIGIYLDDKLLTNPIVNEPIPNGQAQISGGFANLDEAAESGCPSVPELYRLMLKLLRKEQLGRLLGLIPWKRVNGLLFGAF